MHPTSERPSASPSLLAWMAIACGLAAGCNYINQPLLHSIAHAMGVSDAQAAMSVTIAQVSYAVGLLFLVPLGDLLNRKHLVVALILLAASGLMLCALTDQITIFWLGTAISGLFSVAAQVLIPFVTLLVAPQMVGRSVGVLMMGLLVGIQSARSIAGIMSATLGWESVYVLTSVCMAVVGLGLWRMLPSHAPQTDASASKAPHMGYGQIMQSMWELLRTQPRLRSRSLMGSFSFASLSVLFSTMALMLGQAPHFLSDMHIGLISLVGLVGAFMAKQFGKLADQGKEPQTTWLFIVLLIACWPVMPLATHSVAVFAAVMLVLGLCIAAIHIGNQSIIFKLMASARSRANAIYMTAYFTGAASGSALGLMAWRHAGWVGVCALGGAMAVGAMLALLWDKRLLARSSMAGA